MAMLAMLAVIVAATLYGLFAGNPPFAVARQFFGCVLLPIYYFLALALFRSPADVSSWLRRVSWAVALGSAWYAVKLSTISLANSTYYREQSPLTAYCGAIAVVAWIQLVTSRRLEIWSQALVHLVLCLSAILLMGNRNALGSFVTASLAVTLLAFWRRGFLVLVLIVCLLPVGFGVAPYVMAQLSASRGLAGNIADRFIFVLSEDHSYQGRVSQAEAAMKIVEQRPVLGGGMGSFASFFVANEQRRVKVASVTTAGATCC